jgi:hypothetical protein
MKLKMLFLIIISSLLTFFIGCSGTTELTSKSPENRIVINGDASDWGANLMYLPDEKLAVGVSNDNNYFYLCLTTNDMSKVMPMFIRGFIVWLENENNDENTIGIRYPLHNIVNESRIMINPEEFREKGRGMMISKMIKNQNEIRILNKDKFPVTVISTSDSSGLTARLGYNNDQFIYELRVPLKIDEQNKYGINARPGEKILVKFETEQPERGNFGGRDGEGGMRPQGGMGGFPGENGSGGMRPEGSERMSFEPIDFSAEVTLK